MASPASVLAGFARDVRDGLTRSPKQLPPQYFYDAIGSVLFEAITLLPEYGLTRADEKLLSQCAFEVASLVQCPALVAELGSGSGRKTRRLLEAFLARGRTRYIPIDISAEALHLCLNELSDLPAEMSPLEGSYLDGLLGAAKDRNPAESLLVLFLGSTIGNFDRAESLTFLRSVRQVLRAGDTLLLGTDLVKRELILRAAYDDPTGVTAAFNLNLLARINRELGAGFDLRLFRHEVRYSAATQRVEMHLRSLEAQTIHIPAAELTLDLEEGETIWTESSHKYTIPDIQHLASSTGFTIERQWIEHDWGFAETLLRAA